MVHFIITGFPLQDPSLVVQQFMSRNWALTGDGWDAEWPLNFQRLTVWSIAPITRSQGDRVYEEIAPPGRRGGRHFLEMDGHGERSNLPFRFWIVLNLSGRNYWARIVAESLTIRTQNTPSMMSRFSTRLCSRRRAIATLCGLTTKN